MQYVMANKQAIITRASNITSQWFESSKSNDIITMNTFIENGEETHLRSEEGESNKAAL
jgi:hypothetical protein